MIISTHTLTWSVTGEEMKRGKLYEFQLTRSRGAWRMELQNNHLASHFNSHAHVERDIQLIYTECVCLISTHTLTWSVTIIPAINITLVKFQLTRSRGAWHNLLSALKYKLQFQLTRSRGAWPAKNYQKLSANIISTHTLTWSVTLQCTIYSMLIFYFNSHAHVERDAPCVII